MSKNQSRASRLRPQTREEALVELKRLLLAERAARVRAAAMGPIAHAEDANDSTDD